MGGPHSFLISLASWQMHAWLLIWINRKPMNKKEPIVNKKQIRLYYMYLPNSIYITISQTAYNQTKLFTLLLLYKGVH